MPISSLYLLGMRVSPSSRRLKIAHSCSSSSSGMRLKNVGTRPRVSLMSASTSALVWTISIVMLPFFLGAYRLTEVGDGQVEPGMVAIRAYIRCLLPPAPLERNDGYRGYREAGASHPSPLYPGSS